MCTECWCFIQATERKLHVYHRAYIKSFHHIEDEKRFILLARKFEKSKGTQIMRLYERPVMTDEKYRNCILETCRVKAKKNTPQNIPAITANGEDK